MNIHGYPVEMDRLDPELGGGWVAFVRSLPGCVSDGKTRADATENIGDAIRCWLTFARENGRSVPHNG